MNVCFLNIAGIVSRGGSKSREAHAQRLAAQPSTAVERDCTRVFQSLRKDHMFDMSA